eukprot:TRINITY_DN6277_c0_g1_i10.p1 TRINITY_DN6277_c0_g1~~TRINITY_DN6277_c0_g1_i10.p1  ORF type:complete len:378 (+),score=69.23 TRINITY_DN6277_c0_g1_i10:255-1388(+)
MSSKQDLFSVYQWIIDEVVKKVKPEFIQEGVEESVLVDLKQRWEAKMKASDVFTQKFSSKPGKGSMPQHNNVGPHGLHYAHHMAHHPFLPVSIPPQAQMLQYHHQQQQYYQYMQQYIQAHAAHHSQQVAMGVVAGANSAQHQQYLFWQQYPQYYRQWLQQHQLQQQQHYQQQLQQQQQQQQQQLQLQQQQQKQLQPVEIGIKRKEPEDGLSPEVVLAPQIPRVEPVGDSNQGQIQEDEEEEKVKVEVVQDGVGVVNEDSVIPQTDGQDDVAEQGLVNVDDVENQNIITDTLNQEQENLVKGEETTSEEELPLDASLEDVDVSDGEEAEDEDAKNYVMAQYDKVSRTKNRWKAVLSNGVIHVDGKDYLFKKANGEFLF